MTRSSANLCILILSLGLTAPAFSNDEACEKAIEQALVKSEKQAARAFKKLMSKDGFYDGVAGFPFLPPYVKTTRSKLRPTDIEAAKAHTKILAELQSLRREQKTLEAKRAGLAQKRGSTSRKLKPLQERLNVLKEKMLLLQTNEAETKEALTSAGERVRDEMAKSTENIWPRLGYHSGDPATVVSFDVTYAVNPFHILVCTQKNHRNLSSEFQICATINVIADRITYELTASSFRTHGRHSSNDRVFITTFEEYELPGPMTINHASFEKKLTAAFRKIHLAEVDAACLKPLEK